MDTPATPATGATSTKPLPIKIIALIHLLERSLNKLEALTLYGDTALNSTISDLANGHGLVFDRKSEPHQHRNGGKTHFTRYTLAEESKKAAISLISAYENKEKRA